MKIFLAVFLFDEDDNLQLLKFYQHTINIHSAVDTIDDDYRVGVYVDISVDVIIDVDVDVDVGDDVGVGGSGGGSGDVDVDKDLFPAQMSLLSDVNSRGTGGNPLTL